MATKPKEIEVIAPVVTVNRQTGSAAILCRTDGEPIQLNLAADVLLTLQARIEQRLAQERHGGLHMLPVAVKCLGLEAPSGLSRLQIRLLLENGSEARLPIQEFALSQLNKFLTKWFADQEDQD